MVKAKVSLQITWLNISNKPAHLCLWKTTKARLHHVTMFSQLIYPCHQPRPKLVMNTCRDRNCCQWGEATTCIKRGFVFSFKGKRVGWMEFFGIWCSQFVSYGSIVFPIKFSKIIYFVPDWFCKFPIGPNSNIIFRYFLTNKLEKFWKFLFF